MKKISLIIASLVLIGLAGGILAQGTELPNPGLTPDSPFYFLKSIAEGIGTFFTFGDLAKAERYAELATKRLAEAKVVADKGKLEIAGRVLARYQSQLEKSLTNIEQAKARGKSIAEVTEIVAQATAKHLTVLEEVLERVPEQAKPAILRAKESSLTGQIKALENLAEERPERAAGFNIQAIDGRLEKAKKEAKENNQANTERALTDFDALKNSLVRMGKDNKAVLASLVSENLTEQVKGLDEVEDEAENISFQMKEKVKTIKASTIDEQIDVLRGLATVNPEKATEINLKAAEARLNRANAKAEEGEIDKMEEAIEEFENQYNFGTEISQIAQGLGKETTTLEQLVARATSIHLEILAEIYEKVPEQAREAIERAMEVSAKGHEKAVEALKQKDALDQVPEEIPISDKIPAETREKIEEKAKEEIEREGVEMPEIEKPAIPRP